jgi:predicted aconitase with swiveling domain
MPLSDERIQIRGRGVRPGVAAGPPLVSARPFMFAHGVDPATGRVIDVRSDLFGQSIVGTVLVFPSGKGSTTGSAWLLETIRQGNGPVAIVNQETEPIIATALIMARLLYGVSIPLVDRLERDITPLLFTSTVVIVDGEKATVSIAREEKTL